MLLTRRKDAQRFRYANRLLECSYPGISLLLDAYAVVDRGMDQVLRADARTPVCRAGCSTCCTQPIPVTPLEILALRVYARHSLSQESRDALAVRLRGHHGGHAEIGRQCPFLLAGNCGVYPVRPIACRQFIVFRESCRPGEDVSRTRPQDLLIPRYAFMRAALLHTLPWYKKRQSIPGDMSPQAVQAFFRSITTILQAVPWNKYADLTT